MRLRVRFLTRPAILLPALVCSRGFASSQEASLADPIADNLQRARAQHTAAVEKLRGELLEAFETAIKTVARSGKDNTVRIWGIESRRELARLEGFTSPVLCLAWSPDGKSIIAGGHDGEIRIWSLRE